MICKEISVELFAEQLDKLECDVVSVDGKDSSIDYVENDVIYALTRLSQLLSYETSDEVLASGFDMAECVDLQHFLENTCALDVLSEFCGLLELMSVPSKKKKVVAFF